MNKQETAKLLSVIKIAYPSFEITQPLASLWLEFLKQVPFDRAQVHLNEHIASSRFPPTIADIVRYDPKAEEKRRKELEWERHDAVIKWIDSGGDPNQFVWTEKNEESLELLPSNWISKLDS
ncbi:replicative helicase loader/inhibitor [Cohnella fermenti]|uniref:Uncharacterized protein n=1 Tax=Cohnella fermenti TaxID=2565925 RepID=A0A4S4C703_9BACL|nr:replicative helicase loader/inhibitor [Cohnella fermenti]THF83716.1 hypothetical protein E6C55_03225 [Cohnella fermenti]